MTLSSGEAPARTVGPQRRARRRLTASGRAQPPAARTKASARAAWPAAIPLPRLQPSLPVDRHAQRPPDRVVVTSHEHGPWSRPLRPALPAGLIKQFLKDVHWGECDYLVIDSPPGTSDEHISIVQVGAAARAGTPPRLCTREGRACPAGKSPLAMPGLHAVPRLPAAWLSCPPRGLAGSSQGTA